MKIRIARNCIRFRLKQPEVNTFEKAGIITETIEFGPDEDDKMSFCLKRFSGKELAIEKEKAKVTICIPEYLSTQWTTSDLVGFDKRLQTAKAKPLLY